MDQYPDTLDKVMRILAIYQNTRVALPYKARPNNSNVAFLQKADQRGWGAGHGCQGDFGEKGEKSKGSGTDDEAGGDGVSTMTGRTVTDAANIRSSIMPHTTIKCPKSHRLSALPYFFIPFIK
jgi:hypothetical protein